MGVGLIGRDKKRPKKTRKDEKTNKKRKK